MPRPKEEILFEWVCPREVSVAKAKALLRRSKVFVPRVLFITAVVWTALYFALNYILPQDSGINLEKLFILGFIAAAVPLAFVSIGDPLIHMFSRTKYQITPERVRVIGSSRRDIKWKDIIGYKVCKDEELEGFSGVRIYYKKGRFQGSIRLPRDERSGQIVRYIAERVPLLEKPPPSLEIIKLTVWQKVWLCIATALYSLCAAWYFAFYGPKWSFGFMWVVPFLGPGTIYIGAIYRRRFLSNKSLRAYALTFNSFSCFLIMLLAIWLRLWQLKKEVGW